MVIQTDSVNETEEFAKLKHKSLIHGYMENLIELHNQIETACANKLLIDLVEMIKIYKYLLKKDRMRAYNYRTLILEKIKKEKSKIEMFNDNFNFVETNEDFIRDTGQNILKEHILEMLENLQYVCQEDKVNVNHFIGLLNSLYSAI